MRKRFLAILLCLCLVAGFLPMTAAAAPVDTSPGLNINQLQYDGSTQTYSPQRPVFHQLRLLHRR